MDVLQSVVMEKSKDLNWKPQNINTKSSFLYFVSLRIPMKDGMLLAAQFSFSSKTEKLSNETMMEFMQPLVTARSETEYQGKPMLMKNFGFFVL